MKILITLFILFFTFICYCLCVAASRADERERIMWEKELIKVESISSSNIIDFDQWKKKHKREDY